ARPSRCLVEFSVNDSRTASPRAAKMPFATPACSGSDLALGKTLPRTASAAPAAPAARPTAIAAAYEKRRTLAHELAGLADDGDVDVARAGAVLRPVAHIYASQIETIHRLERRDQ